MYDPQSTSSGSIMPSYRWLIRNELDKSMTEKKMEAMVTLGVPYKEEDIANAQAAMLEQGTQIEQNLYSDPDFVTSYEADKAAAGEDFVEMKNREIVALIAYLQRLGTDIKKSDLDNQTAQN
jgi:cytochrome c oxidase cbb3-type subunit I/II